MVATFGCWLDSLGIEADCAAVVGLLVLPPRLFSSAQGKSKKGSILDLNKYMDQPIRVKFSGGREGSCGQWTQTVEGRQSDRASAAQPVADISFQIVDSLSMLSPCYVALLMLSLHQ